MYYMSHPLSVRLNDATIERLGKHAKRVHLAPRTLPAFSRAPIFSGLVDVPRA